MKPSPAILIFSLLLSTQLAGADTAKNPAPAAFSPASSNDRFIALPLDEFSRELLAPFVRLAEAVTGELLVQAPAGSSPEVWVASMFKAGRFAYIAADSWCEPQDEPADPLFPRQWHLRTLRLPQAWQITTGSPAVIVAVVDTGIDLVHPDLINRRVLGASSVNGITWQTNLLDPVAADVAGHGTAVAGVIAASTSNGIGVASVGRDIRLMPIKASASPSGGAFLSDILRGVRAAADAGATAVSVSYTGITNPSVQTTGRYATTAGSMLFWAAGNNAATLGVESDWPDVIIVGATDRSDHLASFSARGAAIDIVAPGVSIVTTAMSSGYITVDGTSFSAPIAAAVAGLVKSANPAISGAEIEGLLKSSSRDLGDSGKDDLFGYGRIDGFAAVAAAADATNPVALPDRILCLTGQTHIARVLENDADPLDRPLAVSLGGGISPLLAAVRVVLDPATGRDAIALDIVPTAAFGTITLPYTVTASGQTSSSTLTIVIDSASDYAAAERLSKQASGLYASYYQLTEPPTGIVNLIGMTPSGAGVVAALATRASDLPPDGLAEAANFAALYTGLLVAPVDGLYTLTLEADDGARITIGSGSSAVSAVASTFIPGTVAAKLRAGAHQLVIEHYQAGGLWSVALSVASVDAGWPLADVVPAESLFRAVPIADLVDAGGNPIPDGIVDGSDFISFINAFASDDFLADVAGSSSDFTPDGIVDGNDFIVFINAFAGGY